MSVSLNVDSFHEVLRLVSYRSVTRIEESSNKNMFIMRNSDTYLKASFRKNAVIVYI